MAKKRSNLTKQIVTVLLTLCMVLGMMPSGLQIVKPLKVEAATHTADEAIAWCKSKVGTSVGYDDGSGEYQCVEFVQAYYQYLGAAKPLGNAKDYKNNIPSGWSWIEGATPQKGDILVYNSTAGYPYGHVAIFESEYSTYHQNYNSKPYVTHETFLYNDYNCINKYTPYLGVVRPNFTNSASVTFENWENGNYTYIAETDAAIGQNVLVSGGTWTRVGMILYDANGNQLGQASDVPDGNTKYYYKANAEMGITLSGGTTYQYRFFADVNGVTYYSDYKSFTTPPPNNVSVIFENWENSNYTYITVTDAAIGQNVLVSGGTWTRVGMILYDANGNQLGQASDVPDGNTKYYYKANAEMGVLLSGGTTYQYRFFADVNGVTYYSDYKSFVTKTVTEIDKETKFGIDVSAHQGTIDWNTVAGQIDFAIIRCGYGSDYMGYDDKTWLENVNACERLGIPYGVYLYSYAENNEEAASEAEHVLRLLKGHTPSLPVYYDLEDSDTVGKLSNEQILNQARIFCSKIEKAGYEAGIYASLYWWQNKLTSSEYNNYSKWVAAYNSKYESICKNYDMWQYSSTGTISGIVGNVDVNYRYDIDTPSTEAPEEHVKGDVDSNGKVELADAQLALKAALKIITLDEMQITVADTDFNSKVDLIDAQKILKVALKIETM